MNLYAYAGNNPVAFTDPFGLDPCKDKEGNEVECSPEQKLIMQVAERVRGLHALETPMLVAASLPTIVFTGGTGVAALGLTARSGATAAVADATLIARAGQVQGALSPTTQRYTTTAALRVTQADGTSSVLVASSERVLRPAQRALLGAGEIAVAGSGHAEITALNTANAIGAVTDAVAVSRPVCLSCAQTLTAAGVRMLTGLK